MYWLQATPVYIDIIFNFYNTLQGKTYYYPHFAEEKTN